MDAKAREFVIDVYQDIKSAWSGRVKTRDEKRREAAEKRAVSQPFGKGREPQQIATVVDSLVTNRGWQTHFASTQLVTQWATVVGEQVAARSQIISLEKGILTIQAQSQNWFTALRTQRQQILQNVQEKFPAANVQAIQVVAPHTANWRHGPLVFKGRGPRDTYDQI